MLLAWVARQPFAQTAWSTRVRVGRRPGAFSSGREDRSQKPLSYSPWAGAFFFYYQNHLLIFRSEPSNLYYEDDVSVSCVGRNPQILKDLLSLCRTEYLKLVEKKTCVFQNHDKDWKRTSTRPIRRLETVLLNKDVKNDLMKDIERFLESESRDWYADRGLPYRRGYILYGPPGTGKSSLSAAVAGHYGLDLYIVNFSGINNECLAALFAELPPRCIVLLEDIDAVVATQTREQSEGVSPRPRELELSGGVSTSGILNVIDGVASSEGRVLIMTTNHISSLDAALIRPGRVDRKIELGLADHKVLAELFCLVFKSLDGDADNETHTKNSDKVNALAQKFAKKVPELKHSPAEVMSFLLENRQSPHTAVGSVEQWIKKSSIENEKIKRADSWVHNM
jgi:mitochondrial chaperone BCS1